MNKPSLNGEGGSSMDLKEAWKEAGEVATVASVTGGLAYKLSQFLFRRRAERKAARRTAVEERFRGIAREEVQIVRGELHELDMKVTQEFEIVKTDISGLPEKTLDLILKSQQISLHITKDDD